MTTQPTRTPLEEAKAQCRDVARDNNGRGFRVWPNRGIGINGAEKGVDVRASLRIDNDLAARAAEVPDAAKISETARSYLYWSKVETVRARLDLLPLGAHLFAKPTTAVMLYASVLMERGELQATVEDGSLRLERVNARAGTKPVWVGNGHRHCRGCSDPNCAYCGKLEAEARQDRDGDAPEGEDCEPFDDATGPMGGGR